MVELLPSPFPFSFSSSFPPLSPFQLHHSHFHFRLQHHFQLNHPPHQHHYFFQLQPHHLFQLLPPPLLLLHPSPLDLFSPLLSFSFQQLSFSHHELYHS